MRRSLKGMFALAAIAAGLTVGGLDQAQAGITLEATQAGWYNDAGNHDATNPNYGTGSESDIVYRNFFVFDLSSLSDDVVGGTLKIFNPANGSAGDLAGAVYTNYDVSTPVASLIADQTDKTDTFDDLGSGAVYGMTSNFVTDGYVTISLTSAALADLNASAGGLFAIGGALSSLIESDMGVFVRTVFSPELVQLALDFEPAAVPEPTALSMASLAAVAGLGVGWMKRRRAIG